MGQLKLALIKMIKMEMEIIQKERKRNNQNGRNQKKWLLTDKKLKKRRTKKKMKRMLTQALLKLLCQKTDSLMKLKDMDSREVTL